MLLGSRESKPAEVRPIVVQQVLPQSQPKIDTSGFDLTGFELVSDKQDDECAARQSERPGDGQLLGEPLTSGQGELEVLNGTDHDAIVTLIMEITGQPVGAMYVRTSSAATLAGIPAARYRVRFQTGSDWTGQRFCRIHGTGEFAESLAFTVTQEQDGLRFGNHRVTLHRVRNGNASTSDLPDVPLPLPPAR